MRSAGPASAPGSPRNPAGRLRLTGEGLIWTGLAAALATLAWFKSLNLVSVLAYGMFALLVLNGLLAWVQVRRIAIRPIGLSPIFAKEPTRIGIRVRNVGRYTASVSVTETANEWFLERLPPGGEVEIGTARQFPNRGRFPNDFFVISSGYPFGLIRYESPCANLESSTDPIIVLPELGIADAEGLRRWILRQVAGDGRARKILRRITTEPADLRGVRPYRTGDSLRAVHWRTSARRGGLFVREYDAVPAPELVVVVEPWLPVAAGEVEHAAVESALTLAATVVRTWVRAFDTRATLMMAEEGAAPHRTVQADDDAVRAALEPLANAVGTAECSCSATVRLLRTSARIARIVVTTRTRSPLPDELAQVCGQPFVVLDSGSNFPWYQPPERLQVR